MININTKKYWDNRFEQNWEKQNGRLQTQSFAESQMTLLELSSDFSGTILDFGCGLGDAMPVYKRSFPKAKLIGVDISSVGIKK
jgi:cyclopropane fatty-acyl-phospholipid synthase-like methyltransferase